MSSGAARLDPLLLITDPVALAELERRGYALGDWFHGRGTGRVTNASLYGTTAFGSIARILERDIAEVARRDPKAGVSVSRFPHRLFDVRWLSANTAHFELVGVTNRFDRVPFEPGTCGEIRLIYRLAYAKSVQETQVASRLPMTLGLELELPHQHGCRAVVASWVPPRALAGEELAAWLVSPGAPLDPSAIGNALTRPHVVVVNAQQVRWPSAVRPDLGGHAEYLLRSFRPTGRSDYLPEPLENTPDVSLLRNDRKLERELWQWLTAKESLKAIDAGTPVLPARFRAQRAESVTPRGLARLKNRPFRQLFAASDFASVDFSQLTNVRSPEGLLRRLDELTCAGCHESRSIAGFHLLGADVAGTAAGNAVARGASPHVLEDLPRRAATLRAALTDTPPDFSQPFPERGAFDGYGAHCGLGHDATFASWTCAAGLSCQAYDAPAGDGVGQCLPAAPRAAGDACEPGALSSNADAHRDRVTASTNLPCAANAVCNATSVGFPGGMCTEGCGDLSASSRCGAIAVLDPFNACVARGEPFQTCLSEHVRPAGLRACSAETPCRDDYVCAGAPGAGTCIPPYFLFQLRVDGHP